MKVLYVVAAALIDRDGKVLLAQRPAGKAMAGLIDMIRSEKLSGDETVVFIHTGGSAALFAYDWFFKAHAGKISLPG